MKQLEGLANLSTWLLLGFTTLAAALLLPGHYLPWPAFRQEVFASAAFIALALAAIQSSNQLVWPRLAVLLLFVALVPPVQYAFGQIEFRGDAILPASYLVAFAASMCIGASLARSTLRSQLLDGLIACLVLVGIVSTGMALSQCLGPSAWGDWIMDVRPWRRPYANLGQPNHLATLLMLGIAALLVWYERQKIGPWAAVAGVAWLGWGVAMTQSRTGWLAVLVLGVWWAVMRIRAGLRTPLMAIAGGLALFALAAVLQAPLLELWLGPEPPASDGSLPAGRLAPGPRWGHWQIFWDALMRSPWFGYGWNQISNAQFAVAVDHPAIGRWAGHSHNLVLDLLLYNGLPLGLLLCAVLARWFWQRVTECRSAESWCLLLALFALFLHALLEFPLHHTFFLLPAGLMMGFLEGSASSGRPALAGSKWTLILPTAGLAVLTAATGLEYLKAEEALRDLELTARHIGPAANQLPRADWYFVDGWAAYHRAVTVTIDSSLSAADYANLGKVAPRYTYPVILERYAKAAVLRGDRRTAQHVLLHSCKVHPVHVCQGMQSRWLALQKTDPAVRAVDFPSLDAQVAAPQR
ncbi:MAG: O-antigen ligase C-terminal domain-containing protein [Burkholderiales bacterium]|nr:O-antigen ligase C-terminal domain-containing protein [Burkholderiales bacterium]